MKKTHPKNPSKKKNKRGRILSVISIVLLLIFVLFFVFGGMQNSEKSKKVMKREAKAKGHEFRIDGQLDFFGEKNDTIISIFIEIAEDDYSREKGLMYRRNIPDTVGMLFVFPEEDYHSFWMKNTPSPLDILYVDGFGKIVRIYENTEPYSEESIPSGELAQYVVEVKGGFCSVHHITTNHRIEFVRFK
jgi:uncharacterized membrane protein (UPF0127 family)